MKKVYRCDLGSLIFISLAVALFLVLTMLSFFAFGGAPLKVKVVSGLLTLAFAIGLFLLFRYDVIITDEAIQAKWLATALLDKYQVIRFDEIVEVWNVIGPFSDMQNIAFKSRDPSKKPWSISVGFGLPWRALYDILERLPDDVKIRFEPLLWKRLQRKGTPRVKALCAKWSRDFEGHL